MANTTVNATREARGIGAQCGGAGGQHAEQRQISGEQGAGTAERRIGAPGRRQCRTDVGPNRGGDHPAQQVGAGRARQRGDEHQEADADRQPVLAQDVVRGRGRQHRIAHGHTPGDRAAF